MIDMAGLSMRMVSNKKALDTVAAGSPGVITGFAFEQMVKVSYHIDQACWSS